jgi:hypothetical protein
MFRWLIVRCALLTLLLVYAPEVRATFDLQITVSTPGSFTAAQRAVLDDALATAEARWERVITGYQPGISLTGITISVDGISSFAEASPTGSTSQGGFLLTTSGRVGINPAAIDAFAAWTGVPGPVNPPPEYLGLNYVDDILQHEIGHILGIGTRWTSNGVYVNNTFQYTGQYGVAAYRKEFDPNATFVPVENAGGPGTPNTHWNQLMRSSTQEGDPSDPWSLDPSVGITDSLGRDLALELMTGALDPDYGQPFLSLTTIQSLRDLGFAVVPEPGTITLLAIALGLSATMRKRRNKTRIDADQADRRRSELSRL